MSIDNPTYFCSQDESLPNTPTSPSRKFSFFRRRSSSSNKLLPTIKSNSGGGGGCSGSELPPSGFVLSSATSTQNHHGNRNIKSFLNPKISKNHHQNFETTDELDNGNATHIFFGNQKPNSSNNNTDKRNKYRERLGSYNETFSYTINDDVFCSNTSSNRSTTYNGGYPDDSNESVSETRRHSIGTFQSKEQRIRSTSFSDEVPTMPAPKAPVTLPNMRKRRENMDDILVITTKHSEHGHIWSNKLKACFDNITKQRGRLPFNFLNVKIDDGPISTDVSYRSKQTKLQIVIICPVLLSLPGAYIKSQLSDVIKPNIALAMFLDIPEEQIMEIHKNIFPSFYQWKRVVVQSSDQSPLSELVGTAVDILGRALREQPLCTEIATPSVGLKGNHDHFTVIPRKVRTGQNKIVAILTEPLTLDDSYRVRIEKSGEVIEVQNVKKRNPFTLQLTVPESCLEVSTMIGIRIEKNGADLGSKPVKCESRLKEMELILKSQNSPVKFMCHSLGLDNSGDIEKLDLYLVQSFQKNVPPNFDLLASLNEKGNFYSYKEARPEEFPTLLHFAAKYGFEKLCLQLVEFPGGVIACDIRNSAGKTPEEIAEDEHHIKISSYLKCFAQMHRITTMYDYVAGMNDALNQCSNSKSISNINLNTETPKDAENLDSDDIKKIKQAADEYMQMNGSGSDTDCPDSGKSKLNNNDSNHNLNYAKLQINSSSGEDEFSIMTNELKITEPSYYDSNEINLKADPMSQECSNLLENYQSEYLLQPSNIPVTDSNALNEYENNENGFGDYLIQPSNIPVLSEIKINKPIVEESGDYLIQPSNIKVDHTITKTEPKLNGSSLKRQGSNLSKNSSADDELLEIINDFKNNVFTIQEVEQLVASWKNRNDVQQSFKDKQDQLQKMREEYDKIQNRMKERLKRPTPFERMKKIFSWGKPVNTTGQKDTAGNSNETNLELNTSKSSYNRPMSSLSLQSVSSSSSGRMSTASACSGTSLGDSGTHSDHEERRHAFSTSSNSPNCRIGSPGSLLDNYMIPPVPRPISTPSSTPTPHEEKERPVYPMRTSMILTHSEHYILYPSNVPVSQTCSNNANQYTNIEQHNYANFSGLHTITETPNEMCITLQPIKILKQYNNDIINKNNEKLLTSFKSSSSNNNNLNNSNFDKQLNKNPNVDVANNNINNSCSNYENL